MANDNTDPEVKPGFLTSEFWATAAAIIANMIAVLVVLGRLTPADAQVLGDAVTALLTTAPVLIANVVVIWRYVTSRAQVKQAAEEATVSRMKIREHYAVKERLEMQRMSLQAPPPSPR